VSGQFGFVEPAGLLLLWLPLLVLVIGLIEVSRSRKILAASFGKAGDTGAASGRRRSSLLLFVVGLALVSFSLSRPSWGIKETTESKLGREVAFVVDVSRSMLAEDLYPNRLDRAKLAMLDALEAVDGDRVALVAFAGNAVIKCPLTLDYGFFKQAVYQLTPDSVARGGSMIGDALRKTLNEVFKGSTSEYRDIILITDGEDQESYPLKAAETLAERNVRLIAIGLGDEDTGKRVPITDAGGRRKFLTYEGQEVWSKLDAETLRQMAAATSGGRYLNVSTGAFDLGEIYKTLIGSQEKKLLEQQISFEREERFQYFLLPGLLFLMGGILLRQIAPRSVR
jgi:Ca-activated chloride channel homolog